MSQVVTILKLLVNHGNLSKKYMAHLLELNKEISIQIQATICHEIYNTLKDDRYFRSLQFKEKKDWIAAIVNTDEYVCSIPKPFKKEASIQFNGNRWKNANPEIFRHKIIGKYEKVLKCLKFLYRNQFQFPSDAQNFLKNLIHIINELKVVSVIDSFNKVCFVEDFFDTLDLPSNGVFACNNGVLTSLGEFRKGRPSDRCYQSCEYDFEPIVSQETVQLMKDYLLDLMGANVENVNKFLSFLGCCFRGEKPDKHIILEVQDDDGMYEIFDLEYLVMGTFGAYSSTKINHSSCQSKWIIILTEELGSFPQSLLSDKHVILRLSEISPQWDSLPRNILQRFHVCKIPQIHITKNMPLLQQRQTLLYMLLHSILL